MLDILDQRDTLTALDVDVTDTVDTFELMDRPSADTFLVKAPIARGFALLVGGALTLLGVAGFLPFVAAHGALLGIFHVDPVMNVIHLLTGLAGLAAFRSRRESVVVAYAIAMTAVYISVFTIGNIAFGDAAGTVARGRSILNLVSFHELPDFMANGMHVTLSLVAFLVAMAAALQDGARATARRGRQQIREYRSHTRVRTAA